jgi:hypothetical protein
LAVIVAKSSQGGEEERAPVVLGFPIDLVADRNVRCRRLNVIGVDSDDSGCDVTWGCAILERLAADVDGGGGGGGGGGGAREGVEEEGIDGVE